MTPKFPSHNAADEFARVIDGPSRPEVAERYADLTRTVTLLREHPAPRPRPEFVADLRAQLMAAADEAFAVTAIDVARAKRPAASRSLGWRQRPIGAAVVTAILIGGTAGLAAAAENAVPGDNLYGLKRGIENVQLALSTSDAGRGRDLLSQAQARLSELHNLVGTQGDTGPLVEQTLGAFTDSANSGATQLFTSYQSSRDTADISQVRSFAESAMASLEQLRAEAPVGTGGAFTSAADALAAIDQQARVLCVDCSKLPALTMPSSMIDLTSASALTSLVQLPSNRLQQLESLARKAQQAATQHPATPTSPPTNLPITLPSIPLPTGGPTPVLPTQPVKGLLSGLSSTTTSLPGQLTQTINGLTEPLTQTINNTLDGVTGAVGGLLGNKQK